MKRTKLLLISCILIVAFALSGCIHMETAFVVHENDTVTLDVKYAINKQKAAAALEEMATEMGGESLSEEEIEESLAEIFAEYSEETINGELYYALNESTTYTQEKLKEEGIPILVNKDKFYLYAASGMEENLSDIPDMELGDMSALLEDFEYIGCSVTLPSPIVETNGEIQDDQTTVVWDLTTSNAQEYELYAYTANVPADRDADRQTVLAMLNPAPTNTPLPSNLPGNTPLPGIDPSASPDAPQIDDTTDSKDTKAPVIKGVKKNKAYKKKVTVYVKDNKKLKKVTVNGKKAKLTKVTKGKYKGYFKFTVKNKGKKTIIAYDAAGNKKKMSIKIK